MWCCKILKFFLYIFFWFFLWVLKLVCFFELFAYRTFYSLSVFSVRRSVFSLCVFLLLCIYWLLYWRFWDFLVWFVFGCLIWCYMIVRYFFRLKNCSTAVSRGVFIFRCFFSFVVWVWLCMLVLWVYCWWLLMMLVCLCVFYCLWVLCGWCVCVLMLLRIVVDVVLFLLLCVVCVWCVDCVLVCLVCVCVLLFWVLFVCVVGVGVECCVL